MTTTPRDDALPDLERCRARIGELDGTIVVLLAERGELAKRTAALKRAAGLPLFDPRREAEVIRRAGELARERELDVEPVRQIFWQIIGLSRRAQESAS